MSVRCNYICYGHACQLSPDKTQSDLGKKISPTQKGLCALYRFICIHNTKSTKHHIITLYMELLCTMDTHDKFCMVSALIQMIFKPVTSALLYYKCYRIWNYSAP